MARALFLVLTQMAIGGLPFLYAVQAGELGLGFFRTMALVDLCLGLAGARWASAGADPGPLGQASRVLLFASLACLAVYSIILWRSNARPHPPVLGAACALGLGHLVLEGLATPVTYGPALLVPVSYLVGAAVLGLAHTGMWLGHWYLTSSTLPLRPLQWYASAFVVAMCVQGVLVGSVTVGHCLAVPTSPVWSALCVQTFHDVMSWCRLLIGLAMPIGFAFMIRETARLGSNMSATGLFYLALGQLLAGELIGRVVLVGQKALF